MCTLISQSHDVTLMHILHGKCSTYFGNSDSTSHSIISHSGLESFVYTNRILTNLCRWKLRGPVIMNHRVQLGCSVLERWQCDAFVILYSAIGICIVESERYWICRRKFSAVAKVSKVKFWCNQMPRHAMFNVNTHIRELLIWWQLF